MNATQDLYGWVEELKMLAGVANSVTREAYGRSVIGMADSDLVSHAFIQRSARNGLGVDVGLDSRLAWHATAGAAWQANGGARFCPSESVAASLVLTKQQPGAIRLPLDAQLLHMPKGFMPSPVAGEYEGMMLIARLPRAEPMIYVLNYVIRPGGRSGSRVMMFSDDVGEDEEMEVLDGDNQRGFASQESVSVRGIDPTSSDISRNAAAMTIRIVRNLASWVGAFPTRPSTDRRVSVHLNETGASIAIGPMVYLKTEVQLAPEMRSVAKSLVRMDANYEVRKMAMRHVVRGHWKRQTVKDGKKMIWVSPYWRGPDGPSAWGRVYRMRDKN